MALGRARRDGGQEPHDHNAHPGEPGVGVDLMPPFVAGDEATAWLFGLNRFGIRPGLSRIEGLLEDLDHPERSLKTIVVAGTNGKGSTTRILARLLRASGQRVVTYTSPHLLRVHERIQIDEVSVDAADFAARVERIRPLTEKHEASWFETLTALAVQIAHDCEADYFCCETGLGGRLDASNALPAIATLLTSVGLDHQRILGDTLPEIAAEKLGLLKTGTPLFAAVQPELRSQVFTAAVKSGSPCFFVDELARWGEDNPGRSGSWNLVLRDRLIPDLPDCPSEAMRSNVALALLALTELAGPVTGQLLPDDPAAALRNLFLPGRFQRVSCDPTLIFDTAHNAQALSHALQAFAEMPVTGRRVVVYGGMLDKTLSGEMAPLLGAVDHLIGVPISLPRARSPLELQELFAELGLEPGEIGEMWRRRCIVASDMAGGLRNLAAGLRPEDAVLVTGSCFLVAEVMHRLGVGDLEETRTISDGASLLARLTTGTSPEGKDGS